MLFVYCAPYVSVCVDVEWNADSFTCAVFGHKNCSRSGAARFLANFKAIIVDVTVKCALPLDYLDSPSTCDTRTEALRP